MHHNYTNIVCNVDDINIQTEIIIIYASVMNSY